MIKNPSLELVGQSHVETHNRLTGHEGVGCDHARGIREIPPRGLLSIQLAAPAALSMAEMTDR
jgi:hypothetical protein